MKQLPKAHLMAIFMGGALVFTSCTPNLGGDDYSASSVGQVEMTLKGKIVALRVVEIEARNPSEMGAGTVIGAVTGAVLGSTIGHGSGNTVATLAGGLAGGAAGHVLEDKMTDQQGFEYQIQLERGDLITITQGAEPRLSVGEKVLVIEGRGRSHVTADNT